MNGAAMSCQQEQARHPPQHNDSSSLHCHEYLLQTNYPCQDQNSHHHYSKAVSNHLLSDNFSVDGSSSYYQEIDNSDTRNRLSSSVDILDDRINKTRIVGLREPMELPVPKFEIDENSVGVYKFKKEKNTAVQDSKDLDLDTRIDLLIKSKALSGMHPIFSDLNGSDESNSNSEDSDDDLSKYNPSKHLKISNPEELVIHQESFDDPEKPLSRPPSPFLSRATYLFWFNKAIELKQQAKAQEKALLEKATKQLCSSSLTSPKVNKSDNSKHKSNILLSTLLTEVSKEIKEIIKQEFMTEMIENTVLNSLEDWWLKETKIEEDKSSLVSSTTDDNFQFKDCNDSVKDDPSKNVKSNLLETAILSTKQANMKCRDKPKVLENQVTSYAELNVTNHNEGLASDVPKVLETKRVTLSCNEDGFVGAESLNGSSEELQVNYPVHSTNDLTDVRSCAVFNSDYLRVEICENKSIENLGEEGSNVLIKPHTTTVRDHHELPPDKEKPPFIVSNESKFLVEEETELTDNSVNATDKSVRSEESDLSFKDSVSPQKTENACVKDIINNEKNFS